MLIIITGASKGIGFELTRQLASVKQAVVIAVSRNPGQVKKLKLNNVIALRADIGTKAGRAAIKSAVEGTGLPIRILINNAGYLIRKPFEKIKDQEILDVYNTNVFAPFSLIRDLVPLFEKNGNAHIVNISSMGGVQGSSKFPGLSAYSSSKAAIAGLSECLAEELKPYHIAVNCLAPGAVQTEMLSRAFPGYSAPLQPAQMAAYIGDFALNGQRYYNGKILPVSLSTP